MKVLKDDIATLKRKRRVLVELDHGEQLIAIHDNRYYQLGSPLDEVMAGHILANTQEAVWCSIEHEWKV